MLIHLLWSYVVLVGYNMHDDKDGSEAGGGLLRELVLSVVFVLWSLPVIAQSKAARWSPMGVQKPYVCKKIALEQKLPIVTLTESGGANLNYAAEVFTYGGMNLCQSGTNVCGRDSTNFGGTW